MKKQSNARLYLIGAYLMLASLTIGMVITALNNALFFDGPAQDGAFQLLNPLRRITEGQVIGRDFSFFHGIGVPLIHWPMYMIFGQGLFGSEISRWTMSPILFALSAFCVFYAFRRQFKFALVAGTAATMLGWIVVPFLLLPITSILGVRSVVPVFLMAIMLLQRKLGRPVMPKVSYASIRLFSWYELIVGTVLAVGIICGTEFGVAAVLGFIIAHIAFRANKSTVKQRAWSAGRVLATAAVMVLALLSVLTLGHPFTPLKYAFIDIPSDQFWYFGVPPNQFVYDGNLLSQFLGDQQLMALFAVALVALFLVIRVYRLKAYRVEAQAFLYGLLAGLFAMVSMLGYYSSTEAGALARMAILTGVASAVILAENRRRTLNVGFEVGKLKSRLRVTPQKMMQAASWAFLVASVVSSLTLLLFLKDNFDIGKTLVKAKNYALGTDTNILGTTWQTIDGQVVPIIEADNNVPVADVNDDGFVHGVNRAKGEVVVDAGSEAAFIHHGQIVYFNKTGRQVVAAATPYKQSKIVVTFQNKNISLDPQYDGAPQKLIVAENFKHDNTKVWSFYTGALNDEMGVLNPTRDGYDYIIHALGQQRRQDYLNDFKRIRPQFVLTFTPQYFAWEGWMQNEHWDLYSLIDQNYEVAKETSMYVVWKRKDQPWANQHAQSQAWQPLQVDDANRKIILPKPSFDNVPDVEAYGQQQAALERQHLLDMGVRLDEKITEVDLQQYDQVVVDKFNKGIAQDEFNRENHGSETEARREAADKAAHQKKQTGGGNSGPYLHMPRPKRLVMLVHLHYNLSSSIAPIPIFGKTVRYIVEPNNTYSSTGVSLRPYAHDITFPIVISEENVDPYLRLNTYSLIPTTAHLQITKAEWTVLDTSAANLKSLTN